MKIFNDINHEDVWLSFKKLIDELPRSVEIKTIISEYSAKLNQLQKDRNYQSIHDTINYFMVNYINVITSMVVLNDNINIIYLLYIRVFKRWEKIHNEFIGKNYISYMLLMALTNYIKNNDDRYYCICDKVKMYYYATRTQTIGCLTNKEYNDLLNIYKKITECAIKYKCTSIINIMILYTDINILDYFKEEFKLKRYKSVLNNKIYNFVDYDLIK